MSLKQRLDEDLKKAMRAKDELALSAIRALKSAIGYREIELKADADEAEVVRLVEKQIKQRRESAEVYRQGGRPELADREDKESAVLSAYLPQRLSAAEIDQLVTEALAESGAKTMKEMGAAMKLASAKAQGRADGKTLSEAIKKKLSSPG